MIPHAKPGWRERHLPLQRRNDLMKLRRAKQLPGKLFARNQ
jgi:hypothetical protein